ncbi:MAG: hypothetical protein ACJAYX_000519 [Planctomycetota bacterium]|jgi:hypothetical protein
MQIAGLKLAGLKPAGLKLPGLEIAGLKRRLVDGCGLDPCLSIGASLVNQ